MRHDHHNEQRAGRMGRGGGPGGPRHGHEPDAPSTEGLAGWFAGRLPDGWYEGALEVTVDRDEILVVGTIAAPAVAAGNAAGEAAGGTPADVAAAEAGRITRFREQTREERMAIAREAEHRYRRTVSWGAQAGATRQLFTTQSVPVMTRLRQPERQVLDTLVAAGVARSRSDALAWSVRLVGRNADAWLTDLRTAMQEVDKVRDQGPAS